MKPNSREFLYYFGAVIATTLAMLLRSWVEQAISGELPTYLLFYPAILLTAMTTGLGPGLLATATAALLADYYIIHPHGFGIAHPVNIVGQFIFCTMGVLISFLAGRYRKLRFRLEDTVAERTAELHQANQQLSMQIAESRRSAEALRESEAKLWGIINATQESVHLFSPEGVVLLGNTTAFSRLNTTGPEVLGKHFSEMIPAELARTRQDRLQEVLRSATPLEFEDQRNGIYFRHSCYPVLDDKRQVAYVACYSRDITRQKQTEDQVSLLNQDLQRKVAELQTIFDTVPVGLAISYDPQGNHIRGNPANEQIIGLPSGSELSLRSARPPGYHVFQDGLELELDQLPMQRAVRGETVKGQVLQLLRRDNRQVTLLANAVPLFDEAGRPRGAVGSFMDISELKRSEERLNLLADTAGTLLVSDFPQSMIEALCKRTMTVLNCQAFFNYLANSESGRLQLNACSGISREEQRRLEWLDYGSSVCGCAARDACRIVVEDIPHSDDPRIELVRSYGIRAYACHPLVSGGELLGTLSFGSRICTAFREEDLSLMKAVSDLVAIALERQHSLEKLRRSNEQLELQVADRTSALLEVINTLKLEISERTRTMEELREKDRMLIQQTRLAAMGDMIGNIAHQWRQPLNTLGLHIQQLKQLYRTGRLDEDCLNNSVAKCMELIRHMSQTIDDFRSFFSPDKQAVEFNVNEALSQALALVQDSFVNQKIMLDIGLDGNFNVIGYPNEYAQSILNILINARDALTERNVPEPCITIRSWDCDGRSVVTISDNAGGVPEAIIDRIFEPYFSTKGPQQGTGVGLFMSRTIIEKNMGGTLSVCNREQGAEFRIEV